MTKIEQALQDTADFLQIMLDDDQLLRTELQQALQDNQSPELMYQLNGISPRAGLALLISRLGEEGE